MFLMLAHKNYPLTFYLVLGPISIIIKYGPTTVWKKKRILFYIFFTEKEELLEIYLLL